MNNYYSVCYLSVKNIICVAIVAPVSVQTRAPLCWVLAQTLQVTVTVKKSLQCSLRKKVNKGA